MPTTTTGRATDFITFSRASLATVTDADGKIKWAPHNLLSYSEQFDNTTGWFRSGYTVAANDIVAPNGTTTAEKITISVGSASEVYLRATSTQSASSRFTLAVFAKAGNVNFLRLRNLAIAGGPSAWFNLSSGTLGTVGSGLTGAITSVGNGWYLCSITATTDTTVSFNLVDIGGSATDNSMAGVLNEFIYLWGAHLYRSDLGGMQANTSAYPLYNPTTPKNLLGYTEDFSNAAWSKSAQLTVTADAALAPNGLQTADRITLLSGTSAKLLTASASSASAGAANSTFSFYTKADGHNFIQIANNNGSQVYANFNLTAGAEAAGSSGTNVVSSSVASVGGGWWRCRVTFDSAAGSNTSWRFYFVDSATATWGGTTSSTGSMYLWGAQLSDSASLDPYSPRYFDPPVAGAYHGPRRDFDPSSLACRGLLVEEQRANLLLHTTDFSNASWDKGSATVSANVAGASAVAPDGTNTADKLVSFNATAATYVQQTLTSTAVAHAFSVYVKADGATFVQLLWNGGASSNYANFNLSLGTVTAGTYTDATITPVGNSWYRIVIVSTLASTSVTANIYLLDSGTAARGASFTGNGVKGVLLWGAQLDIGASGAAAPFATSYIPTGGQSVTRSADVASVATSAFPYSSAAGTVVVSVTKDFLGGDAVSAALYTTSASDTMELFFNNADSRLYAATGGVLQVNLIDTGKVVAGATTKAGFAYATNNYALSTNGGAVLPATTATVPPVAALGIGSRAGGLPFRGWIRQITYIPRRLSNSELQARTV